MHELRRGVRAGAPEQKICDACDALANPVAPTAALRKIGTYALAHELGVGRYANSWLAEPAAGGGVILKLLRAYAPDPETVQRFLEEAKKLGASGKLEHPALARCWTRACTWAARSSWSTRAAARPRSPTSCAGAGGWSRSGRSSSARRWRTGCTRCTRRASSTSISSRRVGITREEDGSEQAVVLDAVTGHLLLHAGLRETGMLPIATAAYLAPELALGRPADGRADLLLAVMLYQLLWGGCRSPGTPPTS